MSKIISSSISTPNKNISAISFFRNFRLISLVFLTLLIVISCGDTTASSGEDEEDTGDGNTGTVKSVTIDGTTSSYTITAGGITLDLTVTVDAEDGTAKTVKWVSSDPDTATVDTDGKVTGVKAGEVRITAVSTVDATKTATVKVTVRDRVGTIDSVGIDDKTTTTLEAGSDLQLSATVAVSGGAATTVKWTTSDEAIATVDTDGKVTGVTPGDVTITVTSTEDRTKADSVALKITAKPLTGFTYTNPTQTVPAGTDITPLVATITPAGATVTYALTVSTDGLTLADDGGISGAINAEGVYDFTVTATGTGEYLGETQTANVKITIVNGPPIFFDDTGDITAAEVTITAAAVSELIVYTPRVRDPDGDGFTLSLENGGGNLKFNGGGRVALARNLTSGTYTADIRATDRDATDKKSSVITLTVNVISSVTSVTINQAAPAVTLGNTTTLTATVVGVNISSGVTWSSDDTTVATIDATTGKVTTVALGTAKITATSTDDTTKSATVTLTVKAETVATAIMDTAVGNANNVQRNYYFLVDVTADKEDKLKLVVKESSEPAPTAAEIKAGAGQTKTLGLTAKTVLFAYPIDSKIGNYKSAGLGHYIHTASSNIDGLFLKPNTAYTVYATQPDETRPVLTGGSYTTAAFDASKPLVNLDIYNNGGGPFAVYDASLFASTLSYHADDPLFILPMVLAKISSATETLVFNVTHDGTTRLNVNIDDAGYDTFSPGGIFFTSKYYDATQTIPHLTDMGTGANAQKASFAFFFFKNKPPNGLWKMEIAYNKSIVDTQPNVLTVTKED